MIIHSTIYKKRCCKLIRTLLYFQINKCFYPGSGYLITAKNLIGCRLSVVNCKRILRVFNKNNLLLDKAQEEHLYAFASKQYQESASRNEFFKNIRKIAHNEITIPAVIDYGAFAAVNLIAKLTRQNNLPSEIKKSLDQAKNEKSEKPPRRTSSLEEMTKKFDEKHDTMIKEIQTAKAAYEKNKTIMWDVIEKWHNYIATRNNVKPNYTPEEKEANTFLEQIFYENTESKEVILSKLQDKEHTLKYHTLKEQSNLSNLNLLEKIQQECFIEQDYIDKINAIKQAQKILNTDVSLNDHAIALLAILADVASLDEVNKPKLNREVYILSSKSPKEFGIKDTDKKPNVEEIMNALRNKHYYVSQSSEEIPPGQLLSTAPLLHKTIVIPTKSGTYTVGMLTSSKTDTELLSLTQESNLDPEGMKKEQRFVAFSSFILYEDSTIIVDLLTLAYTHSINLQGEDVHQKIIKIFDDKKNEWANNFVQEPLKPTLEVLKNITKIFLEIELDIVMKQQSQFLKEVEDISQEEKKQIYLAEALKRKEDYIKRQIEQKYLSKLSSEFQRLFISLNDFEKESNYQKELSMERKKKAILQSQYEEYKKNQDAKATQEKEMRQLTGQLTAKERREAHQQKKLKEKEETQSKFEIEYKDSK